MSYYQNGSYYRPGSSQQQPYANNSPYQPRRPSFESGDEAAFVTNGGQDGYSYGQNVDRRPSYAVRHHDELFMQDASNPPPDMPATPLASDFGSQYHSVTSPTQPAYDPRQFPAPVQIPNPQAYGGVNRTHFDAAAPHQPYNPAAYTENNLNRSGTTAGRGYGYGYDAYPTSPTAQFPSPQLPYQSQYSPSRTYSRPSVQSPTYSNSPGSAPLPPRPLAYSPSAAPPPLPVPPHGGGSPPADWQEQIARRPSMASVYSDLRYNNPLPSPPVNQDERRQSPLYYSNPLPPLPSHSPQRTGTSGRHPQSRPLPGPPQSEGAYGRTDSNGSPYGGQMTSDDLYDEIENAVLNAGSSPRIDVDQPDYPSPNGQDEPFFYASLSGGGVAATNGHLAPENPAHAAYSYSDESDAEAAAGLAALQMAEEEERRGSSGATLFSGYSTMQPPSSAAPEPPTHESTATDAVYSDDDMAGIDLGAYAGNFEPHFTYGGNPAELASGHIDRSGSQSQTLSSSGSQRKSGDASDADAYDPIHPFPPFSSNARVDTFGTGGFAEPGAHRRRLSYDEGDESSLMVSETSTAAEPPEMFYHPGMSHSRPLPPPPAGEPNFTQRQSPSYGYQQGRGTYPAGPDQMVTPSGAIVPRSTSLVSHSHTPQAVPPIRSKTDAEERRLRSSGIRTSALYEKDSSSENLTPPTASTMTLDLPALPTGKRFNPQKLTPKDYARCTEPWALSSIIAWLRMMAEGETDLKEHLITDGLVNLFTHKVPTMNVADAETLSTQVVQEMYKVGTLEHVEEWLKFTPATTSGVLFQLSKAGCYAPTLHEHHTLGRCYSYHCQRTLKKIDLHAQPSLKRGEDWLSFYKIKKEDIPETVGKKEVERQNILHEIVQTEDNFMDSLNVLRELYRDGLMQMEPPVIPPKKLKGFLRDVFGRVDAVKQSNEEHLLPQMKYRQQEQGPWVAGFSDIFREWIRKARGAYIDYAAAFPYATFLVRQEAERNILFRSFLDQVQAHRSSRKLAWDNYLKTPITRLQHYGLLLSTVLKRSIVDNEEKRNLQIAIDEIKAVTLECDARVAEMSRKVDLTDLQSKLILRPGMQRVELNLNHLGRELIYKGDLQRMGGTRYTWLETHALLFDHYLVLAKTVHHRDVEGGAKQERYDVSRLPIPMDLLVLEGTNDDPVVKSSVKGVATVAANARPDSRLRAGSAASPAPGTVSHVNTGSSMGSNLTSASANKGMITTTVLESPKDEKIMYPFRVKHLGKEVYTLFAPSAQNRQDWCEKILEAKTKHAAALFAQNAEPFRLRVMADSAFAYEGGTTGSQSITIKGTPLDRAIDDVEKLFANTGRPSPICRARVNCATAFMQPYGKPMVAVGTDYGVYISETANPRGWSRSITIPRVSQIAVLEEFSIMLLISDKSLIAYHLDLVCPIGGTAGSNNNDSSRRAPQKLSGSRDVGFFATGKMKDRTLVFYKKREGLSSTFKVLEPVFQKSTEKKSRWLRTGRTEFFRDYDEFYIPTECYGLNLFHSSLAVSTSKGFEVLTLDKKQSWSVPDLKASHVATIASRLQGLDPLGMFRLSDQEFLLCYEECAVYVNKHGDVSRSVIMEFVGKAKAAALYGPYVLLFDPDFVEVRNAQNGRLRQVIPGRDVKCLDDGLGLGGHWVQPGANNGQAAPQAAQNGTYGGTGAAVHSRTVKLAMQHPRHEKCQIVVELLLNEGQRD
ncbi:cnh domain protein [Diplodia corticola]|uniref:Cnh domain protein n=1 Tax=Diplodia corticola TaxID=236234 RepID=A0A1J9QQZ8_9PEZI|nr:cnh domain protein [Diplodia corticola]OJD31366.1 cnh domain protein [Diplodia corticola]